MKRPMMILALGFAVLAVPALAVQPQTLETIAQAQAVSPLPLPPQVEKDLAAKASNVSEVSLDKNMLGFASKFMNGKDKDQAGVNQLIQGLDGIYVRDYEFDKAGAYSMDELDQLRQAFTAPEWSTLVHDRERNGAEVSDVMVKVVNGETRGMFILSAEPKEVSIVLILGNIRMDQLGMLKGLGGLGALGNLGSNPKTKSKAGTADGGAGKDNKAGNP